MRTMLLSLGVLFLFLTASCGGADAARDTLKLSEGRQIYMLLRKALNNGQDYEEVLQSEGLLEALNQNWTLLEDATDRNSFKVDTIILKHKDKSIHGTDLIIYGDGRAGNPSEGK